MMYIISMASSGGWHPIKGDRVYFYDAPIEGPMWVYTPESADHYKNHATAALVAKRYKLADFRIDSWTPPIKLS